ncbi:MAG: HAD family hydrolase [Prevotella sp.]|nr:HAD family hydrolase [Prevotella sp.]
MIKGYIFDYGGTLDTAGCHWGKVLWRAYQNHRVPIKEEEFREAYVTAERFLGKNPVIKPHFTFYDTLETKLRLQMEHLIASGYWNVNKTDYQRLKNDILQSLYSQVKHQTNTSARVLSELSKRYPMVLVSNFYGNISVVLKEFFLDGYFCKIIESAVVGIRKPDPEIFLLGVKALGLKPHEIIVVGDSFTKDIIPAKKAGCKTIWFKGEGWTEETFDESIPDKVIKSLEECLEK